jgi:hypothetical protein
MSDRWWETETAWFAFCAPERKLGGWLYSMARPNIGTIAGGCWIWDDTASVPWEVPYSANYTALRLPRDQDLTDIALPTGVSIKALAPLTRYKLGFADEDRLTVNRARRVQRFLSQPFTVAEQFTGVKGVMVPIEETIRGFNMILDGELDHLPELAFLNVGTIDEAIAKGKKILDQLN